MVVLNLGSSASRVQVQVLSPAPKSASFVRDLSILLFHYSFAIGFWQARRNSEEVGCVLGIHEMIVRVQGITRNGRKNFLIISLHIRVKFDLICFFMRNNKVWFLPFFLKTVLKGRGLFC